jgi:hypothetical protein
VRSVLVALSTLSLLTACVGVARGPSDDPPVERACAGLPEAALDREIAALRANVDGAAPLHEGGAKSVPRLVGAVVQVRAAPGMTAPWLGRVLQCDTARRAAAALVPAGVRSEVTATPTGFEVSMRSADYDMAREIERRASLFARPVEAMR